MDMGWYLKFLQKASNVNEANQVKILVSNLTKLLYQNRDFKQMDWILINTDITRFSTLSMISLIRTSHHFKDQLNNWQMCFDNIDNELKQRNVNTDVLLIGMH